MKKNNLFTSIISVSSIVLFIISSIFFGLSATSQTVRGTLNVTYIADNVSFTASAFYQLQDTGAKVDLVDTSNNNATSVTFTPASNTSVKTLSATSNINLTVNKQYVLFTYAFTNNASAGGYCIKVSLTDGTTSTSNVTVKYLASPTKYCAGSTPTVSELNEFKSSVNSSSAPTNVYISAQQTKYFYVLVEITNAYLNSNYNSDTTNGLTWSVENTATTFDPEISTNTVLNMTEDIESDIIITNGATVTINGQGHAIDGSITINSGSVTINNCTIADTVYINGGTTEIQNTTFEEGNPSIVVSGGSVTVHSSGDFCGNVVMSGGTFIIYFPEEEGYYGIVRKNNYETPYMSETVTNGIVKRVYSLE